MPLSQNLPRITTPSLHTLVSKQRNHSRSSPSFYIQSHRWAPCVAASDTSRNSSDCVGSGSQRICVSVDSMAPKTADKAPAKKTPMKSSEGVAKKKKKVR